MVTAVERPAVTDAARSMHGFPAALTSFVGRAGAVEAIAGQLGDMNDASRRAVEVQAPWSVDKQWDRR
jgi:hypothetical protein